MSITKTPTSMIDPSGATNEQVLTYKESISAWMPSDNMTNYTTVGNASAGIFASAVCFIPSDPGTGTWIAPAGCYTARVTLVGGGGSSNSSNGGRSHFNYTSGSTTGPNQMFADGGKGDGVISTSRLGGSAGWNGENNLAIGGDGGSIYGGAGGGGYGGGGGAGGATSDGGRARGGGGGSYGSSGNRGIDDGTYSRGGGGSGGVNGNGGDGYDPSLITASGGGNTYGRGAGGEGGGSPMLSYAATLLTNFKTAISQEKKVGNGVNTTTGPGGGGGWCSAIVSVTPGLSSSYAVGAAGTGAGYGMVVIEW